MELLWYYKDAEILLKSALINLADEQEELRQMKEGTYIAQEHKDHFTKVFTDRGEVPHPVVWCGSEGK